MSLNDTLMQNMKAENGKAARTTEEQYGPCLHSYTIKDAIRDNAVLGFKVNDLRNIYQDDDDENDKEKLNHQYISSIHMREVAKNILQLSYRTLGIRNIDENDWLAHVEEVKNNFKQHHIAMNDVSAYLYLYGFARGAPSRYLTLSS